MPAKYIILPERRLVVTQVYGEITNQQIIDHAISLRAEPYFRPDFRQFADLSEVTPSIVSADAFRAIRGRLHPFHKDAVRAIYATHDVSFGLSRMFEMLLTDAHTLVTRSREAAERHVGLEPGESLELLQPHGMQDLRELPELVSA